MTDKAEQARAFGFETRQLHAGQRPDPNTGSRAVPTFHTTSYVFEDPESAAAYFNLQEYGNTYSRIMNPTGGGVRGARSQPGGRLRRGRVRQRDRRAGPGALFTLLNPGDHVVSSSALYGGTVNQFKHWLRKMNVELTLGRPRRPGGLAQGGPAEHQGLLLRRDDWQPGRERAGHRDGRRHLAHEHELPLIVDNTFAHAVPVPTHRVGRRHRDPLGDQVHRRPRHVASAA